MSAILHRQLEMIQRSAKVARYHAHDTLRVQSVGEHTYGVMWLVFLINPHAHRDLFLAAMMHDCQEYETGDAPATIKRLPGMKEAYTSMEEEVMLRLNIEQPKLTTTQARVLKLADCLEGCLFCLNEAQRGNTLIKLCLDNYIAHTSELNPDGTALDILDYVKEKRDEIFRK